MTARKFSSVFSDLLREKNVSALKVAKDIDVPKSIVYEWKDGRREPTLENFIRLSEYFGVSTDFLSGKEESTDKKEDELIVMLRAAKRLSVSDHDELINGFKRDIGEYLESRRNNGND